VCDFSGTLKSDMASHETISDFCLFTEYGHICKVLPFKVYRDPYFSLQVKLSKKYILATTYSITVGIILIFELMKEVAFRKRSKSDLPNLVLLVAIITTYIAILGSQIWLLVNMKSIVSLTNSFWVFNRSLG